MAQISDIWGEQGQAQESDKAAQNPPQEIDANFLKSCADAFFDEHADKTKISGNDLKCMDEIARFLKFINEQNGINATLRDFNRDSEGSEVIILSVDVTADKLNRKLKEIPFAITLSGADKENTAITLFKFREEIGQGQFVGTQWDEDTLTVDFDSAEGQAALLEHIATRVAAAKLQQQYKDRAKGHIFNRSGAYDYTVQGNKPKPRLLRG
jgi:hypothetical protein